MSGDESRGIARQENNRALDVILSATTPHRDARLKCAQFLLIMPKVIHHVGEEGAWRNGVYPDAMGRELYGEILGERELRALAGVVCHHRLVLFSRTTKGRDGPDVDDAPPTLVPHVTRGPLRKKEKTPHVEIEDAVPSRERVLEGWRSPGRARVVDQNLEARGLGEHFVEERLDLVGLGNVGREGDRAPPRAFPDQGGCLLTRPGLAGGEKDIGPRLGQSDRQVPPDASAAAGHERGLAREVEKGLDAHAKP